MSLIYYDGLLETPQAAGGAQSQAPRSFHQIQLRGADPMWLKQSTAAEIALGPFVDSTDGFTAETGLTITQAEVRLKKTSADWAQKNEATSLVHEENGYYRCLLDATDTNTLGILEVAVNESGALPVWKSFEVVAANIFDSLIGGGDILDASVTQLAGVAQSLTDLKDFADDGYDPATNKVQGVVLVDTLTTYTGNTPQTGDAFARLGAPAGASVSADVAAAKVDTAAILVDTGTTLDGRIPAALVGGRMDSSVGAMAANTMTAAAAAADLTTELQAGLATSAALATVQSDTDDIQTRLPAVLVGGRIDSSVGAMAANTLTASALAADAVDEIWAKTMTELAAVPGVSGTVIQALEWLFLMSRNKITQTSTTQLVRNDADAATIGTSTLSDDGTTFVRGEFS